MLLWIFYFGCDIHTAIIDWGTIHDCPNPHSFLTRNANRLIKLRPRASTVIVAH